MINVGGTGLRRYARIIQRQDPEKDGMVRVPVACGTDMDVMPDCAPGIIGRVGGGEEWPDKADRQWHVRSDFEGDELTARRDAIGDKAAGQNVQSFVSDEWTFQYDLAWRGSQRMFRSQRTSPGRTIRSIPAGKRSMRL